MKAAEGRRTPRRWREAGCATNFAKRPGVRQPPGALKGEHTNPTIQESIHPRIQQSNNAEPQFGLETSVDSRKFAKMPNAKRKKFQRKALMVGVGLDSDGHKRLTTGPNFALVGGSEETHEVMTEKVVKINEKLAARGKQLEEVSREEFDDIAGEVGLHRPEGK